MKHWDKENSPFGVNGGGNQKTKWKKLVNAGICWIRADFMWSHIETTKDVLDWSYTDNLVNKANEFGINIFGSVDYCPEWSTIDSSHYGPLKSNYSEKWHDFFYSVLDRYKNRVKYWGIWNEPNLPEFWHGTKSEFCEQIAYYTGTAFAEFKNSNPDVEVYLCGPELSSTTSQTKDEIISWAKDIRIYTEKGAESIFPNSNITIDVATMHQYDGKDIPNGRIADMDEFYRMMVEEAGYKNKPYWITELGWPTGTEKAVSEDLQAEYLTAMHEALYERKWLNKIFWYCLNDCGDPQKYGLLGGDGEIDKKAWIVMKKLALEYQNRK